RLFQFPILSALPLRRCLTASALGAPQPLIASTRRRRRCLPAHQSAVSQSPLTTIGGSHHYHSTSRQSPVTTTIRQLNSRRPSATSPFRQPSIAVGTPISPTPHRSTIAPQSCLHSSSHRRLHHSTRTSSPQQ
ncbi:hypothetical protein HAX54_005080, partial [Datura stramonium]|nr:hypothetical protein [Datura stramonium]